jgi:hypothetical protein
LTFANITENQTNRKQNDENTLCITRAEWRRKHDVTKKDVTLFIGAAYGEVSRKFAAGILRQFRKDKTERGTK